MKTRTKLIVETELRFRTNHIPLGPELDAAFEEEVELMECWGRTRSAAIYQAYCVDGAGLQPQPTKGGNDE